MTVSPSSINDLYFTKLLISRAIHFHVCLRLLRKRMRLEQQIAHALSHKRVIRKVPWSFSVFGIAAALPQRRRA